MDPMLCPAGRMSGMWQGATEVQLRQLERQWDSYKVGHPSGSVTHQKHAGCCCCDSVTDASWQGSGSSARSICLNASGCACCSCHAAVHSLDFALPHWQPCCRWCPVSHTHAAVAGALTKAQHVMRDADSHAAALGPAQPERR